MFGFVGAAGLQEQRVLLTALPVRKTQTHQELVVVVDTHAPQPLVVTVVMEEHLEAVLEVVLAH